MNLCPRLFKEWPEQDPGEYSADESEDVTEGEDEDV